MKFVYSLVLIVVTSFSAQVYAVKADRSGLKIKTWHPSSTERSAGSSYNGVTRLYFDKTGAWGSTTCRQDAADIMFEDTHLLSSMLAAFVADKTVKVEINDDYARRDNVCKISAVFISR